MKVKKAKIFAPKKVKGGTSLGRDGDVWFAVKCANFSSVEQKAFKTYFQDACRQFFDSSSDEEANDDN